MPPCNTNYPPTPSPPPLTPSRISTTPTTLPTWNTARPILRFDFPNAQSQATFHRAFAQVRCENDKAAFLTRFFDNYDGQVQIPRRIIMDTSRDEALAREVQGSLPVILDTRHDEAVARRLQEVFGVWMGTEGDEEVARRFQRGMGGFGRGRRSDGEMARRMQRQRQRQLGWEGERQRYGGGGSVGYNGGMDSVADRFGEMSFRGRGAYPVPRGPEFGGSGGHTYPQRYPRFPPYYDDGNGGPYSLAYAPGNGEYGYEYDPRYGNQGHRRGGY